MHAVCMHAQGAGKLMHVGNRGAMLGAEYSTRHCTGMGNDIIKIAQCIHVLECDNGVAY